MADVVDATTRSRMMSGISGKHTKPELTVRKWLHHRGFRFRTHDRTLPGAPDLKFPKHNAVVFVNGCFWHQHNCRLFKWPSTRVEFWKDKIAGNHERDIRNLASLVDAGWRVAVIWECALKGKSGPEVSAVLEELSGWLLARSPITPRLIAFPSMPDSASEELSRLHSS